MKYLFKVTRIILGGIALLIVLPLIYFVVLKCIYSDKPDEDKISYLKSNAITIEQNDTVLCEEFDRLLDSQKDFQVFIFGEIHGYSKTQSTDLLLFKYLNAKYNVRDYFAEVFTEDATDLSMFLCSTPINTSYLEKVLESIEHYIPQQKTQIFFDKWVALHKYNQTLPADQKILVHGVLGSKKRDDTKNKSEVMYEEFLKIKKNASVDTTEKSYCFLGMAHALQDTVYASNKKYTYFASKLSNAGYKVTSMIHIPLESAAYLPKNNQYPSPPNQIWEFGNADGPINYYKGISSLKKSSNTNAVMLFKLDAENSPYNICADLVGYNSILKFIFGELLPVENKATTDYFQYVLLTRGSKSATPYIN